MEKVIKKNYIILICINTLILLGMLFYFRFPILENKRLKLSDNFLITKEPEYMYKLNNKLPIYIEGIEKYENKWIGFIKECHPTSDEKISEFYVRSKYKGEEGEILSIYEDECNIINQKYQGFFYINEKGDAEYHLTENDIKKRIKNNVNLSDPNYYIQKYGFGKDINEHYFSRDRLTSMDQFTEDVKIKTILAKFILVPLFFISLIYLVIRFILRLKNGRA